MGLFSLAKKKLNSKLCMQYPLSLDKRKIMATLELKTRFNNIVGD